MIWGARARYLRRFRSAARMAAAKGPETPLAQFYAGGPVDLDQTHAPMAAIDLETDGLNGASDSILEIGYVGFEGWRVDLSTALRARIKP